ncbi:TetR/AcrR family transcriptional regulator [Rhizobium puerariae]|uniref:TetR/AcrR family transcriptional regulator n=1 Tax=Rhizobium puerariae TaxID=1585791 RepID=A0ABV6AGK6_9HYPH
MARDRKITVDDILDAAERVVVRLGAAGLSIDAVAKEAGVSKSRVVYDHKSKAGLLEALIDRKIEAEKVKTLAAVEACRDTPHPELFGRIALATDVPSETDTAVALAVSAAMSSEGELRDHTRAWFAEDLNAIRATDRPQAALLAYLCLTGFTCLELFNFHRWDEAERAVILEGIRMIFTSLPEPG